jgi:hypothetical protein
MKLPTSPTIQAAIAVALLAIGGAAGAAADHATRPGIEMAPLRPVAIRTLPSHSGIVSVRARVAETNGNKIVIDDGSARTLVDLGRAGDGRSLASDGQTVTVQGRFDRGVLHASFLVDASGEVREIGPAGGPPRGHDGPPHGPDGAPPPPAGAPDAGPPPAGAPNASQPRA